MKVAESKLGVKIFVDDKLCKGCFICINICPKGVYIPSRELNERGYHIPIPINIDKCIKCKLCEYYCPDFAIHVEV